MSDSNGGQPTGGSIIPDAGGAGTVAGGFEPAGLQRAPNCSVEAGKAFGLTLKYGFLTLLTLGIYRFWAKTYLRRYFWGAIEFHGDRFAYHGTPKELFIGFILVIIILAPVFILYGFIETAAAAVGNGAQLLTQFVYLIILFSLWSVATFRMLRYRLTRTSWRGVRFGLDGSAWVYLGRAILGLVASVATVGLALPWARDRLNRYRIGNMRFGTMPFRYQGTAGGLYRRAAAPSALFYLPLLGALIFAFDDIGVLVERATPDEEGGFSAPVESGQFDFLAWVFLAYLGGAIGYFWFKVREFRYAVSNIQLGDAHFDLTLSSARVLIRGFLVGLLLLVVAGVLGGLLVTVIGGLIAAGGFAGGEAAILHMVLIGYAISIVFFLPVLILLRSTWTALFWVPLLHQVCEGMTVSNADSLEAAAQAAGADAALTGEGLADAFDVGAI